MAFARLPSTYALAIDCARGTVRHRLSPPEGRHFNGHGTFLAGRVVLASSEQAIDTSDCLIGLRDAEDGFRRMGEAPTGGLGPHDLKRLDSGLVIVANGGIATDPTDRTKLNLATMRPNLAVLDPLADGGPEVAELAPDLHQLSIRHLALRGDGTAGFAMQWEGDPETLVLLLGLRAPDGTVTLAEAPEPEARLMQGYAGSIARSGDGTEVAITSPRGRRVQRFDAGSRFLGPIARSEVCGIASLGRGFLLSDGLGGLLSVEDGTPTPLARAGVAWDNHLVRL